MEVYCVIHGPVVLPAGSLLQLSDAQVSSRTTKLRALELGWYLALTDLTFETGEVLTLYSPPPVEILAALTPPELVRPIQGHPNHRSKKTREDCRAF